MRKASDSDFELGPRLENGRLLMCRRDSRDPGEGWAWNSIQFIVISGAHDDHIPSQSQPFTDKLHCIFL